MGATLVYRKYTRQHRKKKKDPHKRTLKPKEALNPQNKPLNPKEALNPQNSHAFTPTRATASSIKIKEAFQIFKLPLSLGLEAKTPSSRYFFFFFLTCPHEREGAIFKILTLLNVRKKIHKSFLVAPKRQPLNGIGSHHTKPSTPNSPFSPFPVPAKTPP